jgi:hypothetical protein
MHIDRICVVTITRARGESEAALIGSTLTSLARLGRPVVAADGGSPVAFLTSLARLPHIAWVTADQTGLIGQIKAGVREALETGAEYLLYLESDKAQFVNGPLAHFITSAHADEGAGVMLAARSAASFATFPAFQRRTETAFNDVASEIVGVRTDYLYGPFLMHRSLAAHVERASPDLGWGWRPFIFATARRLGLRVEALEGDYRCPPDQTHETDEDRRHRLRQLGENAQGLAQALASDR